MRRAEATFEASDGDETTMEFQNLAGQWFRYFEEIGRRGNGTSLIDFQWHYTMISGTSFMGLRHKSDLFL
jgi:hypothetical protein